MAVIVAVLFSLFWGKVWLKLQSQLFLLVSQLVDQPSIRAYVFRFLMFVWFRLIIKMENSNFMKITIKRQVQQIIYNLYIYIVLFSRITPSEKITHCASNSIVLNVTQKDFYICKLNFYCICSIYTIDCILHRWVYNRRGYCMIELQKKRRYMFAVNRLVSLFNLT